MKRILSAGVVVAGLLIASTASASVYIRYHNDDSSNYTWQATCHGSSYTVEFGSSRTASVTIQGSSPCVIKTPNGEVRVDDNATIEIKNATIKIN